MTGYGVGAWGYEPWGSLVFGAPPTTYSVLPTAEFTVAAESEGGSIRIDLDLPTLAEAPTWTGEIRILRKQGEWPLSADDPRAELFLEDVFPLGGTYWFQDEDLTPGEEYYYALYARRDDGVWICDTETERKSAYPYARWGATAYMFGILPRGFSTADADYDHLFQFVSIFGALVDDIKTDAEWLLRLFEIDNIHDDLIQELDARIGWPTWESASGMKRREETAEAVDLYKILGRTSSYEQILEGITDWECTVAEGWKYVMFSNEVDCTTPDTTDPDVLALRGGEHDVMFYSADTDGWHSTSGYGFFLDPIPGTSGDLTQEMIERIDSMLEWGLPSYAVYEVAFRPTNSESVGVATDSYFDTVTTGWLPSELSPFLWLRADQGVTLGGGDAVRWTDLISGLEFAQVTPGKQPEWQVAGGPNGTAAIYFHDVELQTLGCPAFANVSTTYTWLTVIEPMAHAGDTQLFGGQGNVNIIEPCQSGEVSFYTAGAGGRDLLTAEVVAPQVLVWEMDGVAGTIKAWRNGILLDTEVTVGNAYSGTAWIGSNQDVGGYFEGKVMEIVIVPGKVSAPDMTAFLAYTLGRYGL